MKQQPHRKQRPLTSLSKLEVQKLYLSEHKPSHHQKWNDFADAYPELARQFLIRSNFVREGTLDKGDAYLHAAADLFVALRREKMIKDLKHFKSISLSKAKAATMHNHSKYKEISCNICSPTDE